MMRIAMLVAVLALGLLGMSLSSGHRQPQQQTAKHFVVEGGDFYFDPPGLLVQPGDTIEWVFVEITVDGHTSTAYHPANKKELRMPEAAQPWDSGFILDKEKTFSVTFDTIGIYDYFCLFHEFLGMIGRVIVKEPIGPVVDKPAVTGLPPAAQQAMPSIAEIMGSVGKLFNLSGELNDAVHLYRLKDSKKALEHLDGTLADLHAGADRDGSLFEVLKKVNLESDVEKALQELRNIIFSNAVLETVEKQSKAIKSLLAEARKRLKESK